MILLVKISPFFFMQRITPIFVSYSQGQRFNPEHVVPSRSEFDLHLQS